MANRPYFIILQAVLGAGGAATLAFSVPANEKFHILEMYAQSTGTFNITSLTDSTGRLYSNATVTTPIPSTMLDLTTSPNIAPHVLPVPLDLLGTEQIQIAVLDTSAAPNTVRVILTAIRETE